MEGKDKIRTSVTRVNRVKGKQAQGRGDDDATQATEKGKISSATAAALLQRKSTTNRKSSNHGAARRSCDALTVQKL